jgi:glycogen debranching enzyme
LAPNGYEILNSPVFRLYPTDDAEYPSEEFKKQTDPKNPRVQNLADVIQEALTVHVRGLKFRERNAGPSIDDHMSSEGFNNEIGVDLNTGFVFGGNRFNAGTWMDKMGSSVRAGNNGLPATPRDGSAVELVGLSRYALEFLIRANRDGKYPYDGVQIDSNRKLTWLEWAQKIDANFEKHYWVGQDTNDSPHINKRNIYKDTLKSSLPWTDYQLRPNFLIALTLAPQMFNPEHARLALEQCRLHLVDGPKSIGKAFIKFKTYSYTNNLYE